MGERKPGLTNTGAAEHDSNGRIDPKLIAGVEVRLEAFLGGATMTVAELMKLKAGTAVTLDAALNRDVELRLNGVTVGRGELVTVDGKFGVRLLEINQ